MGNKWVYWLLAAGVFDTFHDALRAAVERVEKVQATTPVLFGPLYDPSSWDLATIDPATWNRDEYNELCRRLVELNKPSYPAFSSERADIRRRITELLHMTPEYAGWDKNLLALYNKEG